MQETNALTLREERKIAERLSPDIAWPTLRLAVMLPIAQVLLIGLALGGIVPFWAVVIPLGYIIFAYYTLVHESIHGNIVRATKYSWVHDVIGWWGAINMMTSYPGLRRIHVLHHQHTNTDKDPDYNLCHGKLWQSIGRVLVFRTLLLLPVPVVKLIPAASYTLDKGIMTPEERSQHAITLTALQLAFWLAVVFGYAKIALWLYWVPVLVGLVMLNVFFQYIPHVPFDRTDRYGNARVNDWPLGHLVLLGQNLHLGHHLWPSVPYYNYRQLNDELLPQYRSVGARLDGFLPKFAQP
jgi:beta-carotene hydroxylase